MNRDKYGLFLFLKNIFMIIIDNEKITYENHRNERNVIKEDLLSLYLREPIKLAEGVTFKRIFDILIKNEMTFNLIFSSSIGRLNLSDYTSEYLKDDNDDDPNSITYLEVYNATELFTFENETDYDHYCSFHGIRLNYTDKYTKEAFDCPISLIGVPLNNLKKYEIKVNNDLLIQEFNETTKKYDDIVKAKKLINVFEFYDAILYEISWFGTPNDRNEQMNNLLKTVDKIKSGEIETTSWEDFKNELDEDQSQDKKDT